MKCFFLCLLSCCLFAAVNAQAQGLLGVGRGIGGEEDFDTDIPLSITVGGGVGWDSNSNTSATAENESGYINGGIGAVYGLGNKTTQLNLGAHFNSIYYFDNAPGLDDDFYNARVTLDLVHRATPRLTIVDNAYFTYEIEPDYEIGASTARRSDQYTYLYNRVAGAYAWSRRVSTVTSYTFSGIMYESGTVSTTEDRNTHTLGNQFRYALSRQTSLTADYRYSATDFDTLPRDSTSQFVLVGVDHLFTRMTSVSAAGGAQFYDDDFSGSDSAPYFEGALNHKLGEDTSLRWAHRLGFEANEIAGFDNRYTYRTGLSVDHKITPYLTGVAGFSYTHSKFSGLGAAPDVDEDSVSVNFGLDFQICPNTDLNLRYYFTDYSSDNALRDYDRHRISIGISTTF